ncbi:hypothetical protein PFZ59_11130 [Streptococcus suis]|uniref:hypothetical protein n=1 Tax=Streptococcus suis TaxID=1307 RepID=UPI001ABDA6E5|nr:hypothetical protein [Streptococcus suis]MBO4128072.1 hypothetical protein [Streptococcus suis]WFA75687.1 hypothetical protein PFZ59_11130 [Streptococcus suis]
MPNWAEGVLKIRGTKHKIANYLRKNLIPVDWFGNEYKIKVEYDDDGITAEIIKELSKENTPLEKLPVKPTPTDIYINGTRRGFIESDGIDIECWTDPDDQDAEIVVTIQNFKQAWVIDVNDYVEGAKEAGVDLHIFGFEKGMQFTQEIEISEGNAIKNICNDKFSNYEWDVPFSNLGG